MMKTTLPKLHYTFVGSPMMNLTIQRTNFSTNLDFEMKFIQVIIIIFKVIKLDSELEQFIAKFSFTSCYIENNRVCMTCKSIKGKYII